MYFGLYYFLFATPISKTISTGRDFVDFFNGPQDDLWEYNEGSLRCYGEGTLSCAKTLARNIAYIHNPGSPPVVPDTTELQIHLRNDCGTKGNPCCLDETCTTFSTGLLISRQVYGHGAYVFVVQAADHEIRGKDQVVDARSCFGLQQPHANDTDRYEILFCLSSNDLHGVTLIMHAGDFHYEKRVALNFDAYSTISSYRIEWNAQTIMFIVNNYTKKTLIGQRVIPQEPMHIILSLLPQIRVPYLTSPPDSRIFMSARFTAYIIAGKSTIGNRKRISL